MPAGRTGDIRAVAREAGVSVSAVSRYLNGKKRLSPPTEQRIDQAAAKLGYAANRVARSLRLSRTQTLALVIPDTNNPFFSAVAKGAEDAARASGYAIVLFNSNEDREREAAQLQTMLSLRCDGALIVVAPEGAGERERRQRLQRVSVPLVFLDRQPGFDADTVFIDGTVGGYEAARQLVRLGHRRIGLVTVDYDVSTHRDRIAGYAAALEEAGLPRRTELEVRVPLTVQDGFAGASRLLTAPEPPTAIFATSNALAIGTVGAVQARGLECPRDVSVVGYDSYEWQEVFAPRLTTVQQPAYLMGQRAATLLLDRLSGARTGEPERMVLKPSLVVRESCAAPPAAAPRRKR